MNENELKEYFHRNRPQTSDETSYLADLSAKMDAVEEIKRIHDATIRKYRRICVLTLASGFAIGAAVTIFILLDPVSLPKISTAIPAISILWKVVIAIAFAAAAIVIGVTPLTKGFDISPIKPTGHPGVCEWDN